MISMFGSVFDTEQYINLNLQNFSVCMITAIILGLLLAISYTYKTKTSKSFTITLAILPIVVAMVIIMVNGNIGAGVAVAGAFSLVRFRSVPGTAKEIGAIFIAMTTGLSLGMGYVGLSVMFALIVCAFNILLETINFGSKKTETKLLKITIPESLNYVDVFDDILTTYTNSYKLLSVKTSNMGSFFKLNYEIEPNDPVKEKELIDKLRCRNGNLDIMITTQSSNSSEL